MIFRYEVLQCGDVEKLIRKRKEPTDSPIYYATIEDTYDIIKRAHIATGHGGRDRMQKELQKKYANITTKALELYKSLCEECQKKRKRPMTKGVVVRPILTKEFSLRGQVDLIDMQAMSSSTHKWIMVYQDHLTKFCVLRSLTTKRASEVAFHLIDIFLLLGAPAIFQSDNGSEFTSHVITELKKMWPDLSMVHGKPRHPQSQGSVERANGDIKDMLVAWMADNNSQDWATGIKFVQFYKNSAYHAGIKCSSYSAMFGCDAREGLTSSSLPKEVIDKLENEDDLYSVVTQPNQPLQKASHSVQDLQLIDQSISDESQPVNDQLFSDNPVELHQSVHGQHLLPQPLPGASQLGTDQPSLSQPIPGPSQQAVTEELMVYQLLSTASQQEPEKEIVFQPPEAQESLIDHQGLNEAIRLVLEEPVLTQELPSSAEQDHDQELSKAILPDKTNKLPEINNLSSAGWMPTSPHVIKNHKEQILKRRASVCSAQMAQAERMVKRSRLDLKAGEPLDNVAIPIPAVDRGREDARNILGVIVYRDTEKDLYRIAVKAGILKGLYSRNQFDLCPQRLLSLDDVSQDSSVSLRSAVIAQSASGGQGFTKCNCNGPKKCQSNRCKCFKAKLLCNSRCHSSINCTNK